MILVRLMGGLGNQMFQYAFGLAQSIRTNECLKVDLSLLNASGSGNHESRNLGLEKFNCKLDVATEREIIFFNGTKNGTLSARLAYKIRRKLNPDLLIIQDGHTFDTNDLRKVRNSCYVGRWQSESYFKDYAAEVRNHFTLKPHVASKFLKVFATIENSPETTVSLHIRRSDYVNNSFYSEKIGFVGEEFYTRAIEFISREIARPHFFVFSDDTEWAENYLQRMKVKHTIMQDVHAEDSAIRDMAAMSLCEHHIIANSTFSWWSAWLGREDGRVIAPAKWANSIDFVPPNIYPPHWVKI